MRYINRDSLFYYGILFSSLDSFPLFSSISTYSPYFSILFFLCYILNEDLLHKKFQRAYHIFLFIGCSLILHSLYKGLCYGEIKGFINFFIQIVFATLLLISYTIYFQKRQNETFQEYCNNFANLFIKANIPIIIIGIIEVLLINFPGIYNSIISFFSYRVSLDRIQLVSGEPSWASRLILTLLAFIPLTSYVKQKKNIIYITCLVLLFATGSTLGILCYLFLIFFSYFKIMRMKHLIVVVIFAFILIPLLFPLLDPYTQKRLLLLLSIKDVDWLTVAVNSGSGSIMARIGNPILGIYMGLDNWFMGVGGGYYYHFYESYLNNHFPTAYNISNIYEVGNGAKNLLCRVIAEFGFIVFILLSLILLRLYSKIRKYKYLKGLFICMILLTINFDSLFHIYPLLIFTFLINIPRIYAK